MAFHLTACSLGRLVLKGWWLGRGSGSRNTKNPGKYRSSGSRNPEIFNTEIFNITESRKFQYQNFQYYRIPKISIPKFRIPDWFSVLFPKYRKYRRVLHFLEKNQKKILKKNSDFFFSNLQDFREIFGILGSRISVFPGIFGILYQTFNNERKIGKKILEIFFWN